MLNLHVFLGSTSFCSKLQTVDRINKRDNSHVLRIFSRKEEFSNQTASRKFYHRKSQRSERRKESKNALKKVYRGRILSIRKENSSKMVGKDI